MRHVSSLRDALWLVPAGVVLLLAVVRSTNAETVCWPAPILDQADLRVHQLPTACNTYILTCTKTKEYVVVDPGRGIEAFVADYARSGHRLRGIWITHEHGDHLTGLAAVAAKTTAPIVAHGVTQKQVMRIRKRGRASEKGSPTGADGEPRCTAVGRGHRLTLGALTWTVLHLPGHSPGSVGYLLPDRVLVAGDVLFQGSIGRTDLSTSDPEVFRETLGTLWELPNDVVVLPGHGAHTTIGAEKRSNRLFQDFTRAERGQDRAKRPWMGIELAPRQAGAGLRIGAVEEDSPASRAGLRVGDVVLKAAATTLGTPEDLRAVIGRHSVGDPLTLVVSRDGRTRRLTLSLGARPGR